MKAREQKRICSERGVAMIELSIVLPFLLLIILATVEIKRYMSVTQIAQTLAREAATIAYRNCTDFVEPEDQATLPNDYSLVTKDRTLRCIVEIMGAPATTPSLIGTQDIAAGSPGLQSFAEGLGAGEVTVIISVFRYNDKGDTNPNTGEPVLLASFGEVNTQDPKTDRPSKFKVAGKKIIAPSSFTLDDQFIRDHQRLVIAEVYARYRPILTFIPIFGERMQSDFYEVGIL